MHIEFTYLGITYGLERHIFGPAVSNPTVISTAVVRVGIVNIVRRRRRRRMVVEGIMVVVVVVVSIYR